MPPRVGADEELGASTERPRIGHGREAEILDWGDGRVLRLMWDPDRAPWLDREERALRAASAVGAPVPAVYERVDLDGRPGLVMERLDGPDMLTRLGGRPWTIHSAGRLLGRVHAQLHEVRAPAAVPSLKDNIRALLERRADNVPVDLLAEALARMSELPDGDRLCHGDFYPGNVLLTRAGPRVVDWAGASRGDPMADVCRTRLLLRMGAVSEAAPALVRRFDRLGRSWLLRTYMRTYGRLDAHAIDRWERITSIARLAEGLEVERAMLLDELARQDPSRILRGARPA